MEMEVDNPIVCRQVKKKHQEPKRVDVGLKLGEQITPKMHDLQDALDENPNVPYETTLVRHTIKKTGYGKNGRFGYVTIDSDKRIVDELGYRLSRSRTHDQRNFFSSAICSRKTCPVEIRIPKTMPFGQCAAIFFGKHVHQIFSDSAYNKDGLLHELAHLLDAVLAVEEAGIDLNFLFDHKRDPYYRFAMLCHYFPHLSHQFRIIYEFAKVYDAFIKSDYYKGDGNYATYCYFKTEITSQSSVRDKVLNVRYVGMRTCDIGDRLSVIRSKMTEVAEFLVVCDGLIFEGVELDTNVSTQTSYELEQLAISCFLNAPSSHPASRLKNKIFITGMAHKIFDNDTYEKMLASYVLVSGLAVNKQVTAKRSRKSQKLTTGSNWFHVDLTPKVTSGINAAVDELKLNTIQYHASLLRAEDDWQSQTLHSKLAAKNSEIEDLNIQLDECKAENEELRSLLPDYMH